MLSAASLAFRQLFTPPFRSVLFKSLGITLLLLIATWIGLESTLVGLVDTSEGWINWVIGIIAGFALFAGLVFLIPPISAIVTGLFLDDIAATVEKNHYPNDTPGTPLPLAQVLVNTSKFLAIVILVNLLVLLTIPLLGIGFLGFFIANGYLFGREFFELAALRFMPYSEARNLRKKHGGRIFMCGLVIACLVAIPIVNLLTPLFATAFMVHIFKQVRGSTPINTD